MDRTPSVLAALGVAIVVAIVVVSFVEGPATAYRVGDHETSQRTVNRELAELVARPDLAAGFFGSLGPAPAGRVDVSVTAPWLTITLRTEAVEQLVTTRGVRASSRDRAQPQLRQAPGFDDLPSDLQRTLVRRFSAVNTLERLLAGDPEDPVVARARASCDSGRYVSHILVSSLDEVVEVQQLLATGTEFAEVARAVSQDQTFGPGGGALGCLGDLVGDPAVLVPAARTQPLDEISEPVQTEFGFHLVLVTDDPSVADVVTDIARRAEVELDPRYGTWNRREALVVPPRRVGA